MPKRPTDGHMTGRDQFVAQMRTLQEARGWSDAGLAERISKHYPMSPSAVWKLNNATPVLGLSLDEALAITHAFDFRSIDQFLSASTAASLAARAVGLAREDVIVYGQQFPLADILANLREAREAVGNATDNGQKLKGPEIANLEAGAALVQRETAELVEWVNEAVSRINRHVADLEATISANGGE